MRRYEHNPILEPIGTHTWESRLIFNAAAFGAKNRIHILYRAMGDDNISRIGLATSSDGYSIDERLPLPVFAPSNEFEKDGVEDPRVTLFDDKLVMAYTAYGTYANHLVYQIGLTSIQLQDFLNRKWRWSERQLSFPGIHNKDAVLFPAKLKQEYIMFHRIEPDICIARSKDLQNWHGLKFILGPREKGWDSWKVGAAGPPILLNEGWLMIYHGVSTNRIYSLGVALLDRDNPETVLYRSKEPILEPKENYELFGKVPNVVFSCGHVVLDNKLLIYYGGADSVLCVATYEFGELLPRK
jgi:predicted GH43/DUF377 family glycosyl hydrolase